MYMIQTKPCASLNFKCNTIYSYSFPIIMSTLTCTCTCML